MNSAELLAGLFAKLEEEPEGDEDVFCIEIRREALPIIEMDRYAHGREYGTDNPRQQRREQSRRVNELCRLHR